MELEELKKDFEEAQKAHNDVVITDRNIKELLKIAKVYETTNREVMSW